MKKVILLVICISMVIFANAQGSATPATAPAKPTTAAKPAAPAGGPTKSADGYSTVIGDLKMSTNHIAFMSIKNNQIKTDTAKIMNNWGKTMTFEAKNVPAHIKFQIPASLEPGKTGLIIVTYDAAKKNDFGFLQDRFNITTNDTATPEKNFIVTAQLEEYFAPMTKADSATCPRISFKESKYDYGKVKQGEVVHKEYEFTNTGKKELVLRKTKASCGCTASKPEKMNLAPGETSVIKVDFNSAGKSGKQSKTITVISNDPITPTITLTISGEVEVPEKTDAAPGQTPAPNPATAPPVKKQ
jgi:hypothetical protein